MNDVAGVAVSAKTIERVVHDVGGELAQPSIKRNSRLIEADKLENPLVMANHSGTSPPGPFGPQEAFE